MPYEWSVDLRVQRTKVYLVLWSLSVLQEVMVLGSIDHSRCSDIGPLLVREGVD